MTTSIGTQVGDGLPPLPPLPLPLARATLEKVPPPIP